MSEDVFFSTSRETCSFFLRLRTCNRWIVEQVGVLMASSSTNPHSHLKMYTEMDGHENVFRVPRALKGSEGLEHLDVWPEGHSTLSQVQSLTFLPSLFRFSKTFRLWPKPKNVESCFLVCKQWIEMCNEGSHEIVVNKLYSRKVGLVVLWFARNVLFFLL